MLEAQLADPDRRRHLRDAAHRPRARRQPTSTGASRPWPTTAAQDVQGRKDALAKQAGVRFARRFVLIVPLGMALVGLSVGNGRAAYETPAGQVVVVVALAMIVVCWLWAGRIMRLPDEQRVFRVSRSAVLSPSLLGWVGATLLLGRAPLVPAAAAGRPRRALPAGCGPCAAAIGPARSRSRRSGEVVAPLARRARGDRLSRLFGVSEELGRPARTHPLAADGRRVPHPPARHERSPRWPSRLIVTLGAATAAGHWRCCSCSARRCSPSSCVEQQVGQASAAWQRRIFLELPIVTEQLGMLLGPATRSAARSTGWRSRGSGACATDLQRVCGRIRQGLGERDALPEWAELAGVEALDRLVAVLALNREAGDLGRLITEEARSIRRDAHRELIETIERRAQQVWIPVTVATLVPGVLFMVVPFVEAMRLFTAGLTGPLLSTPIPNQPTTPRRYR